ncbi:MAG: hypothetical protein ACR2RF_06710 [Geminicoccaceae bacterium]
MQEETADKVNAVPGLLKAFVILGGIGLLVGIIALAVMIMLRATDDPSDGVALPAEPVDLALPAGVRVSEVVVDGKRMVLLGEDEGGQQFIAVVDAESGARRNLIRLIPSE